MPWQVLKRRDQDFIHIIPLGDFEPHDESESCRCEPYIKEIEGGKWDMLIHQAYDDSLNDK